MEDISDAHYTHTKSVCKDFEIKNLGNYHDLYLQSHTFLLAYAFQNFWKICIEIYKLDPPRFLAAPRLA